MMKWRWSLIFVALISYCISEIILYHLGVNYNLFDTNTGITDFLIDIGMFAVIYISMQKLVSLYQDNGAK